MFKYNYDYYNDKLFNYKQKIIDRFNIRKETSRKVILKRYSQEVYYKFSLLVRTLMSIYKDNFDIQIDDIVLNSKLFTNSYGFNDKKEFFIATGLIIKDFKIFIKYPEITIVNSTGLKHIIKDLFVTIIFTIKEDKIIFGNIHGFRATLSDIEYSCGYLHSHLPGKHNYFEVSDFLEKRKFCTGRGQIIDSLLTELNVDTYTEESLTMFFLQLNNYVKWESIEGNPHKYIKDIGIKPVKILELSYNTKNLIWKSILNKLLNNIDTLNNFKTLVNWKVIPIDISINEVEYIPDKTTLNKFLCKELFESFKHLKDIFYIYRNGVRHSLNTPNKTDSIHISDNIATSEKRPKFRGEYINFEIYYINILNNNNYDIEDIIINEKVLYFILEKLKDYAKKARIKEALNA